MQRVTDSSITITASCLISVAIAKSFDSYLARSIVRLIEDRRVLIPESVMDKDLCIESIVYEIT